MTGGIPVFNTIPHQHRIDTRRIRSVLFSYSSIQQPKSSNFLHFGKKKPWNMFERNMYRHLGRYEKNSPSNCPMFVWYTECIRCSHGKYCYSDENCVFFATYFKFPAADTAFKVWYLQLSLQPPKKNVERNIANDTRDGVLFFVQQGRNRRLKHQTDFIFVTSLEKNIFMLHLAHHFKAYEKKLSINTI